MIMSEYNFIKLLISFELDIRYTADNYNAFDSDTDNGDSNDNDADNDNNHIRIRRQCDENVDDFFRFTHA